MTKPNIHNSEKQILRLYGVGSATDKAVKAAADKKAAEAAAAEAEDARLAAIHPNKNHDDGLARFTDRYGGAKKKKSKKKTKRKTKKRITKSIKKSKGSKRKINRNKRSKSKRSIKSRRYFKMSLTR